VNHWDQWVSSGLTALRKQCGNRWLDSYLRSPTWRFLVTPGFMPAPFNKVAWGGVLMPSVDRVGRYYPLTLISPLTAVPDNPEGRGALWAWMQRLEDIAIDALESDWSIDTLEAKLAALGLPPSSPWHTQDWDRNPKVLEMIEPFCTKEFFDTASKNSNLTKKRGCCVWCFSSASDNSSVIVSPNIDDSIVELWCRDTFDEASTA
jgi:type VI secretion system ImpM family protein